MTWEQRKTLRLKPKKRIFVSLGSNLSQVGKIIDICPGGLAFEFISDKKAQEGDTHVDIFTLEEGGSLSGLACSLAYQTAENLPGRKDETEDTFKARRCGLRFHQLKIEQWCRISDLIEESNTDSAIQNEVIENMTLSLDRSLKTKSQTEIPGNRVKS